MLDGKFDASSLLGCKVLIPEDTLLSFVIEEEPQVGRAAKDAELNVGECAVRTTSCIVADWSALDVVDKEVHDSMDGKLKALRCESSTMLSGDGLLTYEIAHIPSLVHNNSFNVAGGPIVGYNGDPTVNLNPQESVIS
jgi:hypothetical protein